MTVGSQLNHSGFVALRAKDAIVDQIRERWGIVPPSIGMMPMSASSCISPMTNLKSSTSLVSRICAAIGRNQGSSLRENLAAAMLRMSGWDRQSPLIDPMCGSGTIAIEAAQWAQGLAPGLAAPPSDFSGGPVSMRTLRIGSG